MSTRPLALAPLLGATVACLAAFSTASKVAPDAPTVAPGPPAHLRTLPPPTEHWLGEDAESRNKSRRKAFYNQIHRAPPDVDWRQVERKNGLARIARRNLLSQSPRPPEDDGTARWQERGSDNQAGRMHVARHSPDPTILYAGSSKGGVWKGTLDGTDWEPIGDNLYGGAHWLEVLSPPSEGDPAIVLAATDGGLIHRTDDDGVTWVVPTGLDAPTGVRRLVRLRDGTDTVFILTTQDGSATLRRSEDGGQSFTVVYDLGAFYGDLFADRTGTSDLYLASAEGLLHSDDFGDSWTAMGDLPDSASRAELAGSEAGAPRLWLVTDSNQLYRSDDAGETWFHVSAVSDYWGTLNASIQDEDLFAWGGVHVHRTADAGSSFAVVHNWWDYYNSPIDTLHADIPGLDVELDSTGAEVWYIDTDGGLYRSLDGLQTVENLSLQGLRVSQYYDVHTSVADPAHIIAGAQDQGYQLTNTLEDSEDDVLAFDQILSGDYGHLTSSDGTHGMVYSVYPGFILVQHGEEEPWLEYVDFPPGESYPWLPHILADPTNPDAFFFPAKKLYRYELNRDEWGWERTEWSEEDFSEGGGDYATGLAFSPLDPDRAYLATSDGRAYHSEDGGVTWTQSRNMAPDEHWLYGQTILASSLDVDTVLIGGSGYGTPGIYKSIDGGMTFQPFADGIEDTMVYTLGEAPDGSGRLVAGTQQAVFRRDPEDSEWLDVTGTDAPITTYWSVEALHHENTMRFATYGRGIWDYQFDPDHTGCFPVQDYDGDGVLCTDDCDDHDADTLPGAEELCDGIDRNCDPTDLDETDFDGDGFFACDDCDDTKAGISPDAEEICGNLIDEDCDGEDLDCDVPLADEPEVDPPAEDPPDTSGTADGDSDKGGCAVVSAPGLALAGIALLALARRREA